MNSINRFKTICIAMAAGMILSGVSFAAATDGSIEIRLWTNATVTDPEITLGQIATVSGDETTIASLKKLTVVTTLRNNPKSTIRAWQIAERIGDAGYDVSQMAITGAASCQVTLTAETRAKTSEAGLPVDQAAKQATPASLEGRLREVVCRNLTTAGLPKDHEVKISFNPGLRDLLALTNPPYEFEITPPRTGNWLGLVLFKVKVYRDGQEVHTLPILAEVHVRVQLIVAAKTINSKARIAKTDIEKNWREVANMKEKDKFLCDTGDVLDQQAKKMIPAGALITRDLLEPLPMIKRGQLVTVIYRKGGLDIRTVAKAMQSAFKNEVIQVRNERSKEVFRAKVIGPGQVCVEGGLVPGGADSLGMTQGNNP